MNTPRRAKSDPLLRYLIAAQIEKHTGEKTPRDDMDEIMRVIARRRATATICNQPKETP